MIRKTLVSLVGALTLIAAPATVAFADTPQLTDNDRQIQQQQVERADRLPLQSDKSNGRSIAEFGSYPLRKGVILVTPDKLLGLIPTGHAGIVYDMRQTIESVTEGVSWRHNNWAPNHEQVYGVSVRSTSVSEDGQSTDWAAAQVGKPYNYNWLDVGTRDRFYCSQLVWASFKDNFGINLDTGAWGWAVHPMELVNNDKVNLVYRKKD